MEAPSGAYLGATITALGISQKVCRGVSTFKRKITSTNGETSFPSQGHKSTGVTAGDVCHAGSPFEGGMEAGDKGHISKGNQIGRIDHLSPDISTSEADTMDLDIVSPACPYRPLGPNEIRLARVESSHDDYRPLCVRLLPVNIQVPPTYDAISYVWGDDAATVPILCDGLPTCITKNLSWALTRARQRCSVASPSPTAVVVWADALCINQLDHLERGAQVALMGRIYANARTVLACMGPDLSGGGGGHVASLLREWQASAAAATTMNINTNVHDERWTALGALTGAPWFERMWVLQEVGLARDPRVIYGGGRRESGGNDADGPAEEFSYRLLRHVVAWTRQKAPDFAAYMGIGGLHIHDWWSDWSQLGTEGGGEARGEVAPPSHYQFLDLLDHGALLKCRDPRDRIYAFLGHPLAAAAGSIIPDYVKPKIQVYQEITILLLHDSDVRALSSVEHDAQTIEEEAPSWVIRWDVTPTFNNIWSSHNRAYRAGAGLIMGEFLALDGDVLQVEGVVADSISNVFPIQVVPSQLQILLTSASADHWQHLAQFASELEQNTNAPFAYGTTARAAILAHALCGQLWDGQDQKTDFLRAFSHYISCHRGSQDMAQTAGPFYWRAESLCRGRAFIITSKGYYGLAPGICRPGDICAVVKEGAVPLLLRPQSPDIGGGDGSTMPSRLVGEMYLQGFMEGYAASMVREGKLRQELLRIR